MIKIKLEQFEGPLSLLLKLIEKEEMDVTQVSLANVADQYISYIRESSDINPDEMADFLMVASRILLIKSKALLPYLYAEEEQEIEDLELQLKMYKEFLEATKKIEKRLDKKKFMFAREFSRRAVVSKVNTFSPPKKLQKKEMALIFKELLGRIRPPEKLKEETLDRKINIEEKILYIQEMLMDRIKISFNKVLDTANNKTEVIVSFLAMLEMMRQREVILDQDKMFGEIVIQKAQIRE